MSDVLRGQVPALDDTVAEVSVEELGNQHVLLVAEKVTGAKVTGVVGILRGALLGPDPEIEFRCEIEEALNIMEAPNLSFNKFELHHDKRIVPVTGPFIVKAARIDEINVQDQLCTLGLHLARKAQR